MLVKSSLLNQLLTTFKLTIMKKVFFLGAAALFSLALVATSCSDDDNDKCTTCTDGDVEYEVCWEEGNQLDALAKLLDFASDHPNAICDNVDTY
jgi:hypothetical protein